MWAASLAHVGSQPGTCGPPSLAHVGSQPGTCGPPSNLWIRRGPSSCKPQATQQLVHGCAKVCTWPDMCKRGSRTKAGQGPASPGRLLLPSHFQAAAPSQAPHRDPASSSPCIVKALHRQGPASSRPCIVKALHRQGPAVPRPCIVKALHRQGPSQQRPLLVQGLCWCKAGARWWLGYRKEHPGILRRLPPTHQKENPGILRRLPHTHPA